MVSEFQMEGDAVRATVPAIWSQQCPTSVYQAAETSDISPQRTGLIHCPRRPPSDAVETGGPGGDITTFLDTVPSPGLLHQLGEELPHTNSGDPVPRLGGEFITNDSGPTRGQAEEQCSDLQTVQQEELSFHSRSCLTDRKVVSDSNGSPPGTIVLPGSAATEEPGPPKLRGLLRGESFPLRVPETS